MWWLVSNGVSPLIHLIAQDQSIPLCNMHYHSNIRPKLVRSVESIEIRVVQISPPQ